MPKIAALMLAACLALSGCTIFKSSHVWDVVTRTHPDVSGAADPSLAYAAHLHRVLAAEGVEHRVVTYQFHYRTLLREESIGSRTAVIYRDDTDPAHPWWLTDERLSRPIWLPNGSVEKQVAFTCRNRVEIVRLRDFSGGADGKRIIPPSRRAADFRTGRAEPLRSVALGPATTAGDAPLGALFRTRHGTPFDPASSLDREKMTALRHALRFSDGR